VSATDDRGLCINCGGHGSVIVGERPAKSGRTALVMAPCTWCNGHDHVTPMAEAQAEADRS
jgi:hypothetical protein